MADEDWRTHERRWRADPSDQAALAAAVDGMRRAGLAPPSELLDAQVEPARQVTLPLPLEVWAVLPDGREVTLGWGPGPVDLPACRVWGVTVEPSSTDDLRAAGDLVRAARVPGLRIASVQLLEAAGGSRASLDLRALRAVGPLPHLRGLELPAESAHPVHVDEVLEAASATALQRLWLESPVGRRDRSALLPRLARLPHHLRLRDLRLRDAGLQPADLRVIAALPELDALDLSENPELALAHVRALPSAERLRALALGVFGRSDMCDEDLLHVAALPALERLELAWWYDLTRAGAAHLARAPALRDLTLIGCYRLDDDVVAAWADALPLRALRLRGPRELTDQALSALSRASTLEHLELTGYDYMGGPGLITDQGLAGLGALPRLTTLTLGATEYVQGRTLGALRALERLRHTAFTDDGLAAISGLARLRSLSAEGSFTRAGTAHLARLQALEELEVRGQAVDDTMLAPLRAFSGLTAVTLAGRIGDETLRWLAGLPRLRRLGLVSGASLDAEGVARLQTAPVRELFLTSNLDADDLAQALEGHPTLRRLTVHGPARRGLDRLRAALPLTRVR
ncbi:MAG: hypothetical protein M9894_09235 [Planctomycetes bacterium]|nr:hypothetical protein [Planctomycetota bacterium]